MQTKLTLAFVLALLALCAATLPIMSDPHDGQPLAAMSALAAPGDDDEPIPDTPPDPDIPE